MTGIVQCTYTVQRNVSTERNNNQSGTSATEVILGLKIS